MNMMTPGMMTTNPYLDRLAQMQQQQSASHFATLGKIVENEDVVKTTDIPMDGNMYYFPKADGSVIYGKQWLANGTTRLIAFKPTLDEQTNNVTPTELKCETDPLESLRTDIMERLERIEKAIKPKKEVKDE